MEILTDDAPPPAPLPKLPKIGVGFFRIANGDVGWYRINGSGYLADRRIRIRAVNITPGSDRQNGTPPNANFYTTSAKDGKFSLLVSFPTARNQLLNFTATDGRTSKSDLTGILWSNSIQVRTP